ncbi:MAG TPA: SpoIIE family protein phosphatase, partial [Thermoanaerobaculia bacterium]|nr:SpoIIE family protein phosphatase [Thermoanaerobaculia bacterium]
MSTRRAFGLAVAVFVLLVIAAYTSWRVDVISRRGWAGFSYVPPIGRSSHAAPIAGLVPGSVVTVYPGGPADRAGIKSGDVIVGIDGIPASDLKRLVPVETSVKSGSVVRYSVMQSGRPADIDVRFVPPLATPVYAATFVTSSVVSFLFLVIGTFVFWRRPTDTRAFIFFLMTLVATITFANTALLQAEGQNTRGIVSADQSLGSVWHLVFLGCTSLFFAPLLLHLALIFPRDRPVIERRPKLFTWIYGYPAAACLYSGLLLGVLSAFIQAGSEKRIGVVLGSIIVAVAVASLAAIVVSIVRRGLREGVLNAPQGVIGLVVSLYACGVWASTIMTARMRSSIPMYLGIVLLISVGLITFATYPIATFIALFRSYRESGVEERRQVKWPIWATMLAVTGKVVLSIAAFGIVFIATVRHATFPGFSQAFPDILSKLLYLLIPIAFAFAILKYRLMNIDVIIRRTVLYSMLTFVVFALYAVVVAAVGTALVKLAGLTNSTMLIASTVIVAVAAVPIRNQLQRLVDRNLFREKRDYALALRNIGNAIGGASVDEFLRYCAEQIQQALQNRVVIIAVRRDQEFVAAAKVGVPDDVLGRVRATATDDSALRKVGATLIIPVRNVALLALGSKLSDEEFSAEDREFLDAAAAQIAIGIENVRLRVEEVEFEQARQMQQILLPKEFPQLNGFEISGMWHPARSVGGDYFDTLALGGDHAAICIGDVAGKGMPAALLMANLQAAVKATASASTAPAMVCTRVKEIVGGNLQGGKFISFFYGVLDGGARTFSFSNAGHNPPILVRANGDVERLDRGGPAICRLFRDIPQEQATTRLAPGDRIVLFTDGATEARR